MPEHALATHEAKIELPFGGGMARVQVQVQVELLVQGQVPQPELTFCLDALQLREMPFINSNRAAVSFCRASCSIAKVTNLIKL